MDYQPQGIQRVRAGISKLAASEVLSLILAFAIRTSMAKAQESPRPLISPYHMLPFFRFKGPTRKLRFFQCLDINI